MNVAFFVRSAPPVIDGVGEYTWHLASSLRHMGVDARIYTDLDQFAAREMADWVYPVIPSWTGRSVVETLIKYSNLPLDWGCFQYVPQMYGRRGICWGASEIPSALRQKIKCRVATTFHEFIPGWKLNPKGAFLSTVMRLQTRRALAGCDLAITTCSRYVHDLQTISSVRLPVLMIPVGANISPVEVSQRRLEEFRQQHQLHGARVFGVFGRLAPFRNYPSAIRVLDRAIKNGINARLMLIGCVESSNPALFHELLQLARGLGVDKQLIVTGDLSAEEVSLHLQLVDVFLFPLCDGLSTRNTTVMTAMAHGLPIIFHTPRPGNYDGYRVPFGRSVPIGDEEGFIQSAVYFLKEYAHDSIVKRQANKDYFEKHFSWSSISRQYLEAFTER